MKITLFGATGLVGSHVLERLKNSDHQTIIFNRRSIELSTQNTEQYINKDILSECKKQTQAHNSEIIIFALGSTIKKAGSKEKFKEIDYELIKNLAQCFSKDAHIILISALGANKDSFIFYNKIKGLTETSLKEMGFKRLSIIRPSLIIGERNESRPLEAIAQSIMKRLVKITPQTFKPYTAHYASEIANTVIQSLKGKVSFENIQVEVCHD